MDYPIRILLIDDSPTFRSQVIGFLRGTYMVAVANDGFEGFNNAAACPPDLLIIDVKMPVWDGLRTLKAFRAHPAFRTVPILMLTGDASRESVTAAISGGVNDYMLKDALTKELLLEKLAKLLGDSRTVREAATSEILSRSPVATPHLTGAHKQEQEVTLQSLIDWE